jgi:hypothetical protein
MSPKEGVRRIIIAIKIHRSRPGFEPVNLVSSGNHGNL